MKQGTDYFRKLIDHYKAMGIPVPEEVRNQLASAERAEKEAEEKRAEAIAGEKLSRQRAADESAQSERDRLAEQLEPIKKSELEVWLAAGGAEEGFGKYWPERASQIMAQQHQSALNEARVATAARMRKVF